MNTIALLLFFTAAAQTVEQSAASDVEQADRRTELKTALPYAIELLEKKEYQQFIEQFSLPDELKRVMDKQKDIARLTGDFERDKATYTLRALKSIQGSAPEMQDRDTVAVFKVDLPNNALKEIVFVRLDKHWFIRNQPALSRSD